MVKSEVYSTYFFRGKDGWIFFLMFHLEIMDNAQYFPRVLYDAEIGHFQHVL